MFNVPALPNADAGEVENAWLVSTGNATQQRGFSSRRPGQLSWPQAQPGERSRELGDHPCRDINPLGRGDGNAYVGGALNMGRIGPKLPTSMGKAGSGNNVNNCGQVGCSGGRGGERNWHYKSEAQRDFDKCVCNPRTFFCKGKIIDGVTRCCKECKFCWSNSVDMMCCKSSDPSRCFIDSGPTRPPNEGSGAIMSDQGLVTSGSSLAAGASTMAVFYEPFNPHDPDATWPGKNEKARIFRSPRTCCEGGDDDSAGSNDGGLATPDKSERSIFNLGGSVSRPTMPRPGTMSGDGSDGVPPPDLSACVTTAMVECIPNLGSGGLPSYLQCIAEACLGEAALTYYYYANCYTYIEDDLCRKVVREAFRMCSVEFDIGGRYPLDFNEYWRCIEARILNPNWLSKKELRKYDADACMTAYDRSAIDCLGLGDLLDEYIEENPPEQPQPKTL